jgi:AhpD family alkylhydroperoxidase
MRLEIFDPPMCCSTGVCGVDVDPELARFSADLEWLRGKQIPVERFNLAQQPGAFAESQAVLEAMQANGQECLPLFVWNGQVVGQGTYPEREQLAAWIGLDISAQSSLYSQGVAELVAIGAAIAGNCEPCLKYHYNQARKLGVSAEDMQRAVATAQTVKEMPARAMQELAQRLMGSPRAEPPAPQADARPAGGCCG